MQTHVLDRLDPAKVDALIAHLCSKLRARVFDKEDSPVMRGIAEAFGVARLLGILPGVPMPEDFLAHYATTLGPFIFIPKHWTPRQKLLVILHELVHVVQFYQHPFDFPVLYLTQPEARATYEAQAYPAEAEAVKALDGDVSGYTPENTVAPMTQGYNLGTPDVTLAADVIDARLTSIKHNILRTPAVLEMKAYLAQRGGPESLAAAA